MKLSHILLLAAAAWMEKGHACEELIVGVKECLGDGQEGCEDCMEQGPEFDMEELGPEALKESLLADAAKCTAEGQPCAPCADLLMELEECEIAKMDMDIPDTDIPDEPPAQGGLRFTVTDDTHLVTADGPESFAGDVENLQGDLNASCYWTGCKKGGCPNGYNQIGSKKCRRGWAIYGNEHCCPLRKNCFWTGCSKGGCPSGMVEKTSKKCWSSPFVWGNEYCCPR